MCFTVNVNLVKEELENRYGATLIDPENYRPSYYYHAFALPSMPVICSDRPAQINQMTWGLIPARTKDSSHANIIRYKTFNARAENLETKPSFISVKSKRCIVPVVGFYEWQHTHGAKIPWYVCHTDFSVMSLAGIYDDWVESATGEMLSTFSIVTTVANELMEEIHNSGKRMPVVLDDISEKKWIDLSIPLEEAMMILSPCPPEDLLAYTISPLINNRNVDRNTPEVIKPYVYQKDNLLF